MFLRPLGNSNPTHQPTNELKFLNISSLAESIFAIILSHENIQITYTLMTYFLYLFINLAAVLKKNREYNSSDTLMMIFSICKAANVSAIMNSDQNWMFQNLMFSVTDLCCY